MKKKVIILGGGVAGMTAAQELGERGFEVEVYELDDTYCGGKAKSFNIPNTSQLGKLPLPGEHGFRFFPGFYKHIIDTMQRIPYLNSNKSVADNLVTVPNRAISHSKKKLLIFPTSIRTDIFSHLLKIHEFILNDLKFEKGELRFYFKVLLKFLTSSSERRIEEFEKQSWWDFLNAENKSKEFKLYLSNGITQSLVAANSKELNAKTACSILIQLLMDMTKIGFPKDRILNGPTNDTWLTPWFKYLTEYLDTKFHFNSKVVKINSDNTKITSVIILRNSKLIKVVADFYISALPINSLSNIISKKMIKADKTFSNIKKIANNLSWMNGLQFFLKEDVKLIKGHLAFIDSKWSLTCISQSQFWNTTNLENYGDGKVKGILSIVISDWFTPGIIYNKMASKCSKEEIKKEVWAQMKKSISTKHNIELLDSNIHSWHLDPSIRHEFDLNQIKVTNLEPLFINVKNSWHLRPKVKTNFSNFFLAADFVQTQTDLATMEAANEAARLAVNYILLQSKQKISLCKIWKLKEPFFFLPFKLYDKLRYKFGLPWKLF